MHIDVVYPNVDFGSVIPNLPSNFTVIAELTGPGISSPITVTAKPGELLMIPPLPMKGTYILDNIRLVSRNEVILYADPKMALIDTFEKLLITQVVSRPLSIDEIEALGITINPEDFTAYSFTVGFGTETGPVKLELPVIIDYREQNITDQVIRNVPPPQGSGSQPPSMAATPNIFVQGIRITPCEEDLPKTGISTPIAGAIVIPGNIAFLNQFFEGKPRRHRHEKSSLSPFCNPFFVYL